MEDPYLTDAGGKFVGALPGACAFDSCFSFGLIRGGHLDVTVRRDDLLDRDARAAFLEHKPSRCGLDHGKLGDDEAHPPHRSQRKRALFQDFGLSVTCVEPGQLKTCDSPIGTKRVIVAMTR